MNYEEIINYVQSKCKNDIFREIDSFLTNLDDTQNDIIELEGNKFNIKKDITDIDCDNGTVVCKYTLLIN
ncbi:hypothetical protein [Clostridium sp. VAP52]|uniref:hypothetical protein n=1 Tax=Clostridium sp. VAP52 TaxID=2949977 RepID=UPI002079C3F6|nr:hypothetical protein [Clostridium sp. VAP52]